MDEGARAPGVAFDRGARGLRSGAVKGEGFVCLWSWAVKGEGFVYLWRWAVKGEGFVYLFGDVAGGRVCRGGTK